ncbi:uncharacterized protein CBO05P1_043 [Clostridium botulinum B str. Osaka05]|uniref:DNA primase n=1 Tax=Clostridium botulinum B str. Osaka05 TaxID=1407017 RepID=A0A060N4R0_CLOBO|nr:toprim domain-containing protein [Clostridium botulinum]BAO04762.1 uncharacterized protein CBO05P1_043 [Clostridium botulinum B str. Osaka05]
MSAKNDLKLIKQRIYKENKIGYLLEQLGCNYIKTEQNGLLITAGLPDGFNSKNKRTVQVKNNESLTSYIRSFDIKGDIYNIVAFVKDYQLPQDIGYVKNIICDLLGYEKNNNYVVEEKKDWLSFLHKIKKNRYKDIEIECKENILPEITLEQYINQPVYEWYLEGLNLKTQKEFEVGLDFTYGEEKIIFPMRNEKGDLVSVKARIFKKYERYYEGKKYFYLYPYDRRIHLYNHYKAKKYAREKGFLYVYEGAKTVMFSWQYGIKNCVSTEGNEVTERQIKQLCNLSNKIVFIFDKDIDLDFYKEKILKEYKHLLLNKVCYCVIDRDNLLGEKEYINNETDEVLINKSSPTDKGKERFLSLIEENNWIRLEV